MFQDNVYGLLYKITEAKRLCIQDGHHNPTNKDIAARAGMTVEKLERLLMAARSPISLEQSAWADQNTTYHVCFFFFSGSRDYHTDKEFRLVRGMFCLPKRLSSLGLLN